MKELLIVATSALRPEQESMQADSPYPQVEYVMLAKKLGADYLNYSFYDRLPLSNLVRRGEVFMRSDIALAFAALRKARRYKTVFAMSERVGILLAFFKRMGWLKAKLIFRFTAWSGRQEKLFTRFKLLPFIDHIIVESKPLGELLASRYGVSRDQMTFVPYAIDVDYFSSQKADTEAKNEKPFLFSAGEIRGRDYATLIEAVGPMADVDVEIAASGTWFAREKDDQLNEKLTPNIHVAGRKPHTAMRDCYAQADCVVIPLHDQLFSAGVTVALEALAMGKPIVATRSQGLAGYLEDGKTCKMVPPEDTDALRSAISHLLENRDCAAELGRNARTAAEERFGLESYVARFEDVIRRVQAGK